MPTFRLNNDRLLEVSLQNEKVMALAGAMVAYDGTIKFEKSLTGGEGFFGALKRKVGGEAFSLMITSGTGTVYFANKAREIKVIELQAEKIFVESSCILAMDVALKTNTVFAGLHGAASGQGLATTTVEGKGNLALMSHGQLLEFEVNAQHPLFVDPDAFIAYKGNITREFVFDVSWQTMMGKASGETYQIKFSGEGTVYVQPSERK